MKISLRTYEVGLLFLQKEEGSSGRLGEKALEILGSVDCHRT
jgi:hypothetical protein